MQCKQVIKKSNKNKEKTRIYKKKHEKMSNKCQIEKQTKCIIVTTAAVYCALLRLHFIPKEMLPKPIKTGNFIQTRFNEWARSVVCYRHHQHDIQTNHLESRMILILMSANWHCWRVFVLIQWSWFVHFQMNVSCNHI